ncbi:MAG: hypothetical protein ISR23_07270 [Candidatus Poseidoniaceae archaeon]|nr:hypothetical protein [Candidatus Poseidoniaceae archaeon]
MLDLDGKFMERQPPKPAVKAPPKETFARALNRVRSQTDIRNDIMRASLETAQRLQEGRGTFMLYGF